MGSRYKSSDEGRERASRAAPARSGRYDAVKATAVTATMSWASVDVDAIATLVRVVAASGGALTLGTRRDGTALYVSIYDNGQKYEWWLVSPEEANVVLNTIIDAARAD